MKYCPKCGRSCEDHDNFCLSCGAFLNEEAPKVENIAEEPTATTDNEAVNPVQESNEAQNANPTLIMGMAGTANAFVTRLTEFFRSEAMQKIMKLMIVLIAISAVSAISVSYSEGELDVSFSVLTLLFPVLFYVYFSKMQNYAKSNVFDYKNYKNTKTLVKVYYVFSVIAAVLMVVVTLLMLAGGALINELPSLLEELYAAGDMAYEEYEAMLITVTALSADWWFYVLSVGVSAAILIVEAIGLSSISKYVGSMMNAIVMDESYLLPNETVQKGLRMCSYAALAMAAYEVISLIVMIAFSLVESIPVAIVSSLLLIVYEAGIFYICKQLSAPLKELKKEEE